MVRQPNNSPITAARADVAEVLEQAPSLRREIAEIVEKQARIAAELAAADLTEHGESAYAVQARLTNGGFTADQVLGDWFPETAAQ